MKMEYEELEDFTCEECGATFDTEEAYEMHMEDHEMMIEQEELSAEDQAILIQGLLMSVHAEEHRLKKLYGYKIPKSTEKLSKSDLEGLEREMQIRDAMTRYVRVATGEEDFDPSNWYVAPQEEFDPKNYKPGENVFKITHYTKEHEEQIKEELDEKPPTAKLAEDIIKGKYNEPLPEPKTGKETREELTKDPYEEITEKLWKFFEPAWNEKSTGSFDDAILLNVGKEIFRYMKCPSPECNFSVPKKLSQKEKYVELLKHYLTEHLAKVKIKKREGLAIIDKYIEDKKKADPMEEARKAFSPDKDSIEDIKKHVSSGPLMEHQRGTPNLESCSAEEKFIEILKTPEDSGKQFRSIFKPKKDPEQEKKTKRLLLALEGNSSRERRKRLLEKEEKEE